MKRFALATALLVACSGIALALSFGSSSNLSAAVRPFQIRVASLRNNGVQDLVTCNYSTGNMSVFLGNGDGTFAARTDYAITGSPTVIGVAIGDLNGDGTPDVVVASSNLHVFLNNGNGTFAAAVTYTVLGGTEGITGVLLGDTRATGHLDAVLLDNSASLLVTMNGVGDGTFSGSESSNVKDPSGFSIAPYYGAALADLTGDGKLDVVCSGFSAAPAFYGVLGLYGHGDGTFGVGGKANWSQPIGNAGSTISIGLALGDLNGDGKPDLVVAQEGGTLPNGVCVLLGNGDGTFGSPGTTVVTAGTPGQDFVALADLDGSGHLSALVNCDSGGGGVTFSILPGDGTGALGSPVTFAGTSNGTGVAVADFNSDGKLDVAVTGFVGSNNVMVWLQTSAGFRGETPGMAYSREIRCERRNAARVSR